MSNQAMDIDDEGAQPVGGRARPLVVESDDETTDSEATQKMEDVAEEDLEEEDRSGPTYVGGAAYGSDEDKSGPVYGESEEEGSQRSPAWRFEQDAQGSDEDVEERSGERNGKGSASTQDSQATQVMASDGGRAGEGSPSSSADDPDYVQSESQSKLEQSSEDRMSPEETLARKFITLVGKWLATNDARAVAAANTGSGWEGWLQVELYCFVTKANIQVEREPRTYPGDSANLRGDLVLDDLVTVELKAKTERESAKAYGDRVAKDAAKVEKLDDAAAIVLGLSLRGDAERDVTRVTEEQVRAGSFTLAFTISQGAKLGKKARKH